MNLLEQRAQERVGTVSSVAAGLIVVDIESDAPQGVALTSGIPMRFPRVNGFILIPVDSGSVVGIVNWVGVENLPLPRGRDGDSAVIRLPYAVRRVRVTPLGMLRLVGADASGR